jgi:hypothetical protein
VAARFEVVCSLRSKNPVPLGEYDDSDAPDDSLNSMIR